MSNSGDGDQPEKILKDLENIKTILDEPKSVDDDVPILDDPIEALYTEDHGMPEATFNTLLGDAWQESVDELFAQASQRISDDQTAWLPQDSPALAQALKMRIDLSVRAWLAETLETHIGALRERIVKELSAELLEHLAKQSPRTTQAEEKDG